MAIEKAPLRELCEGAGGEAKAKGYEAIDGSD
jgi:hypothetical protein